VIDFNPRDAVIERMPLIATSVAVLPRSHAHRLPYSQIAETAPIAGPAAAVKRAIDVLIAGVLLLMFALPMGLIAVAIKLDSPGPVLFRQRRVGKDNSPFDLLKFRTMYHRLQEPGRLRQTTRQDKRVTRVGAVLRRLSVDELPQLLHVISGQMSLVGPRPHAPGTCAGGTPFEQVSDWYPMRHSVRPGMTGLAQVRGWRGETDTREKLIMRLASDLEYIETWRLGLDFVILVRTVGAVLRMRNAY
jgi:lipopolysaccharide/colanic/teichoic acid biosynthesis glycosyltransferase